MYYTGKTINGKRVCLITTTPALVLTKEDNTYTLIKGMFSTSEIAYVQRSNDMYGFLLYLDKYLAEGAENIIDFVGTESELLAYKKNDKRIKEALEHLQSIQ